MLHENVVQVLKNHLPHPTHDDFVFTTPNDTPIDQANFYRREWVPILPYISYMLDLGARPLWVVRQTGTSLDMIDKDYGRAKVVAEEFDCMINKAEEGAANARDAALQNRNLPGTFESDETNAARLKKETPEESGASVRAGDRGRTGDVQLGKLAFYR